jgi:hypothetical protein
LHNLWQKQWLFKKISALPYLFQGVGLAGAYSRGQEGQLVDENLKITLPFGKVLSLFVKTHRDYAIRNFKVLDSCIKNGG